MGLHLWSYLQGTEASEDFALGCWPWSHRGAVGGGWLYGGWSVRHQDADALIFLSDWKGENIIDEYQKHVNKMIRNPDNYYPIFLLKAFSYQLFEAEWRQLYFAWCSRWDKRWPWILITFQVLFFFFNQYRNCLIIEWLVCVGNDADEIAHEEQLSRWGLPVASVDGASGKNGVENNLGEQVQQHRTTWDWSEIVEVKLLTCEDFLTLKAQLEISTTRWAPTCYK